MSDEREWLRPKAFGDQMPIVLTLDEPGADAPWFWSDPSKTFDAGSKIDQAPVWLFHVTSQDGRQWTLDGNLKMTRAIAALEVAHGPLGDSAVFTLEKRVIGQRHDWIAVLVNNPNPPNRQPINPQQVQFIDASQAAPAAAPPPAQGYSPPGGVPPGGVPPGGVPPGQPQGVPPASPPPAQGYGTPPAGVPGTQPGVPPLQGNTGEAPALDYAATRDVYRAPWSKKQARALWDMAAEAAGDQVQELIKRFGDDETDIVNAGDLFSAYQGMLATYVIHGQRAMHPTSFGDEGPMPESVMDRLRMSLDQTAKSDGLDPDAVTRVLMRVYMEADPNTKLGSVMKRALNGWENFKALVLEEMGPPADDVEPDPGAGEEAPSGPGSASITDDDIPF